MKIARLTFFSSFQLVKIHISKKNLGTLKSFLNANKVASFFTDLTKILFGPDRLVKKKRKEKHQITRILSKCEGPKVKSKQCRPQLAIWVVSFHALWCQELWNGSTPFQLKHRVIYCRVLTTKPLEYRDFRRLHPLFTYVLCNTPFVRNFLKLQFFIHNFFPTICFSMEIIFCIFFQVDLRKIVTKTCPKAR